MEKVKISSGKSLSKFLTSIIDEGVKAAMYQKALQEKEKQSALAGNLPIVDEEDDDPLGLGGDKKPKTSPDKEPAPEPEETPSAADVDTDDEALKSGEVTPDVIVDKLNSIRSGKSFRDSTVKGSMEQYVNALKAPEKTALLAFLKGISQIVTGEVEAPQAADPEEHPADVKMKKGEDKQVKHVKPNVIKGAPVSKKTQPSKEDTSGPAPITPVKK
jgi:hypothetical protein